MPKNIRSLIFLAVLACIALFLIGFRYGKHVGLADSVYVPPSPTPTITLTPTPTVALGIPAQVLKEIKDKNCKTVYKLASPESKLRVRQSSVVITCTEPTKAPVVSTKPTKGI